MPYRRTPKMEARLAETRERIIQAALGLVARGGYAAASIPAIAAEADISAGLIYRYFDTKVDLFHEVFQRAAQMEIDACETAAGVPGTAAQRIAHVVQTFATRALRGRAMAWALLAEPVDPLVDAARLQFRTPYRAIFARLIEEGIERGELAPLPAQLAATAIVGAIAETLVGPLSAPSPNKEADARLIAGLVAFCVRALGPLPSAPAGSAASSTVCPGMPGVGTPAGAPPAESKRTRRQHGRIPAGPAPSEQPLPDR